MAAKKKLPFPPKKSTPAKAGAVPVPAKAGAKPTPNLMPKKKSIPVPPMKPAKKAAAPKKTTKKK